MTLASLDLNLLRVFDAVLRCGSVTQAGRMLGLSQPAMSNALGRLRHHYGDPLFVRTPNGMEPTARALRIAGPVRRALEEIELSLRQVAAIDPAAIRRRFRVALVEYAALYLQTALVEAVSATAPRAELVFAHAGQDEIRRLVHGEECDLVLGVVPDKPQGWTAETLFHERWTLIRARNHPRAAGRDSRALFDSERHVRVPMNRQVDQALASRGFAGTEAATAPDLISACFIVSRTDLVATMPEGVARTCEDALGLAVMDLPVELPALPIDLVFHPRHQGDPEHDWLRRLLAEVAGKLRGKPEVTSPGLPAWQSR